MDFVLPRHMERAHIGDVLRWFFFLNLLKNLKLGEVVNNVDFGTWAHREILLVYRDVLRTTYMLGKRC